MMLVVDAAVCHPDALSTAEALTCWEHSEGGIVLTWELSSAEVCCFPQYYNLWEGDGGQPTMMSQWRWDTKAPLPQSKIFLKSHPRFIAPVHPS